MGKDSRNAFYFGDNLHVLREYVSDESIDLIYLDPPFNSNANYNLLFKSPDKKRWSDAQITTFEDTWRWGDLADAQFRETVHAGGKVGEVLSALRRILGENDMLAYLTMMTARLVELHRVLKPAGSLFLHCDQTASHYLKVVLDAVFGFDCFRSEVTWKRTHAHGNARRTFGCITDEIFFYAKSRGHVWNQPFRTLSREELDRKYPCQDPDGRRWQSVTLRNPSDRPNLKYSYTASNGITYQPHRNGWSCNEDRMRRYDREGRLHFPSRPDGALRLKMYEDDSPGERIQNLWDDIGPLSSHARERLGYPTQKPVALLERIIAAASNEGDLVLDPFCGCGTTLHAAQNLGRHWIGIDVAVQAMQVVGDRLRHAFPSVAYDVFGLPADADSAMWLAARDPFKFEEWACLRIGAMHSGRFRNDGGIDGSFYFLHGRDEASRGIVSVKAGRNLNPGMVRDLVGTLQRERQMTGDPSTIAVLITAHPPTSGMVDEARRVGRVETMAGDIPAVQILSVADLFGGRTIQVPLMLNTVTAAAIGRKKDRSAAYTDPREIFRQREILFTFSGTPAGLRHQQVLPERRSLRA
ncbi:site-specific DNA-methyltransferase [Paracoccus kondratievae]|uniref:DNA methyltransferase n=1 Tax=Paracoccus kondratievae TaxID=135740 RepID=UPI00126611DD|nr:DNA methyltransferase [Paracoccus kondratievae]QFQ88277.1 site-specific DNA-methyltransferase [Paracoccus kondratievae]